MDSRERTFLALDGQEPDRIPVDFWASSCFRQRLEDELGLTYDAFLDQHEVDFRYIAGPTYIGPPLQSTEARSFDIWGVPRRRVTVELANGRETYAEVVAPPLASAASVEDIVAYALWPSPDWFDYGPVREQCQAIRDAGRVAMFMGDRLNRVAQLKPAMYLRGTEQILLDLVEMPELVDALLGRIRTFYLGYLERVLEAAAGAIDIVLTGDDFGSQNGLLISPAMWDRFLREGFTRYLALAKHYKARTMHHTCGSVVPIIPAMIECGLDVLQSLQPEAQGMAMDALKPAFGDQLGFQGGVSVQRTLPFGTPAAVDDEVRQLAEVGGRGGGYIFCTSHNIQADVPMENVQALMAAYRKHGRY